MDVHLYVWVITAIVLVAVLAIDVFVIGRRPHEPSMKEAGVFIAVYVALAIVFGIGVGLISGWQFGAEFFTGWLVEYSLSIDNLFIFVVIMGKLAVPRKYQQYALMIGIVLALIFRGIFIALGAAIIERFAAVFFLFGAFLIYTAIHMFVDWKKGGGHDDDDPNNNVILKLFKKRFPATDEYHGTKLLTRIDGKRLATPMLMVVIALGTTDLLFALDSIPAIYGITREPYLVFTANVFALMGLRQLFFLIGGLLKRLVYLSVGLSVILAFIGVKLVLHALHETHLLDLITGREVPVPEVPIWLSLVVIVVTLAITTVASLMKSRRDDTELDVPGHEGGATADPTADGNDRPDVDAVVGQERPSTNPHDLR